MHTREVSETALSKIMADRFVEMGDQDTSEADQNVETISSLAGMLVEPALNFLADGRRVEAAALFEAAVYHSPGNPDALNNLGFCLLPDYPERAFEYLERANETGLGDRQLINVNRMLALALLGRRTSAIDLATTHLHETLYEVRPYATWLWDIDSVLQRRAPKLIECQNLSEYAEAIVLKLDISGGR